MDKKELWEKCVAFHGHECGGLTIGYKAALYAADLLELTFSSDEEVVCISENDACGIDAIQVILGCSIGKGNLLREGTDLTIVATGLCVNSALEAAEKLAAEGVSAEVINIHTIKPLDEEIILKSAKKTGKVVTAEEHSVIGGLGSAVCDVLSEKLPTPVKKIGVYDVFGESGPAVKLLEKYKLDGAGVYEQIKDWLK